MAISLRLLLLAGIVAGFKGHWWGRDAAWAFVLARTGIRLNESVDLRRSDLDLAGGRLRIDQGQGRKDPSAYLSETTQRVLTRYLAALPALLSLRTLPMPLHGLPAGPRGAPPIRRRGVQLNAPTTA